MVQCCGQADEPHCTCARWLAVAHCSSVLKRATAAGELSEEEQSELSLSFGRLSSKPMPKDWPTPDPRHPRMLLEDFDPEVHPRSLVEHRTTACTLQKSTDGEFTCVGNRGRLQMVLQCTVSLKLRERAAERNRCELFVVACGCDIGCRWKASLIRSFRMACIRS